MNQSTNPFSRFVSWLQTNRNHQIIFAAVLLLLIAGASVTAYSFGTKNSQSPAPQTTEQPAQDKISLYIESNIPGVVMAGAPYCDAAKANTATPYACELEKDQTQTTITAPAEATYEGKTYTFTSWDGCSEGNEDWKICKVNIDGVTTKNIVATYTLKAAAQPQKPANTANKAPVCTKQDAADATKASCKFSFTEVPAKTILEIRMYASECGKSLKAYLTFTSPAPCNKEHAGYYAMDAPDDSSAITCADATACVTDMETLGANNSKRVTISKTTTMDIKVPRDTTIKTKTYCRYMCEPMPGWFNEWAYTYDAATKTFRVTAFYLYRGFDG